MGMLVMATMLEVGAITLEVASTNTGSQSLTTSQLGEEELQGLAEQIACLNLRTTNCLYFVFWPIFVFLAFFLHQFFYGE